jgi:glycosyltransferase involved in cell wall biosynthesis
MRVCLISPDHVAFNSRLVHQANALHAANYDVHVIAGWFFPPFDKFDHDIYANAPWKRHVVYYMTGPRVLWHRFLHRAALNKIARAGTVSIGRATRAIHPAANLLVEAAKAVEAELYIAYGTAALPAAEAAARQRKSRYGVDLCSLAAGSYPTGETDAEREAAGDTLHAALLPACAYITTASPLLTDAVNQRYAAKARTVLGTYPRREVPVPSLADPGARLRFFWSSEAVSSKNRLDRFVKIVAESGLACEVHIHAWPASGLPERLRLEAQQVGFSGDIKFHTLTPWEKPAAAPRCEDWGLSLEPANAHGERALDSRIFAYLANGLPVVLNSTAAHRALAAELGDAVVVVDLDNPESARAFANVLQSPSRSLRAREAVRELVADRLNWERGQTAFLDGIQTVLRS